MNIVTVTNSHSDAQQKLKGKVIRKADIARKLLSMIDQNPSDQIRLIDVKPDNTDSTHQRSVFVFEQNDAFEEAFSKIIDENRKKRASTDSESEKKIHDLEKEIEELKKQIETKE